MGSMNSAWCEITGSAASCGVDLRTYCTAAPVLPSRSYRKNISSVLSIEEVLRITIFFMVQGLQCYVLVYHKVLSYSYFLFTLHWQYIISQKSGVFLRIYTHQT